MKQSKIKLKGLVLPIVYEEETPYFHARTLCGILGYRNMRSAVSRHCLSSGIKKMSFCTAGGLQRCTFVSPGNLIELISKCTLPGATEFRQWFLHEYLPTIMMAEFDFAFIFKRLQLELENRVSSEYVRQHILQNFCIINGEDE